MNNDFTLSTQNHSDLVVPPKLKYFVTPTEPAANTVANAPVIPNQNRLITAANKIFSVMTEVKRGKIYDDLVKLRRYLLRETDAFQSKAEEWRYDHDSILISRYALSASLDEMIDKTEWGKTSQWTAQPILQELQQEITADERFFVILERISQAPAKFIDAIELMYICLSLGFEGKFKCEPEKTRLQQIIDYTYHIIRMQRGEFEKRLSPAVNKNIHPIKLKRRYFPIWGILLITLMTVVGVSGGFNYLLNIFFSQLTKQVQTISTKTAEK